MLFVLPEANYDAITAALPAGYTAGYEDDDGRHILVYDAGHQPAGFEALIIGALGGSGTIEDAVSGVGGYPLSDKDARLFDIYHGPESDVTRINYRAQLEQALHRVVTLRPAGEYREVIFYMPDKVTPALRVRVAYARDVIGGAMYRWVHREWFAKDGTVCAEKWSHKQYDHDLEEQDREATQRRKNIISDVKLGVRIALVTITPDLISNGIIPGVDPVTEINALGVAYIDRYVDMISTFERTGYPDTMRTSVQNDTEAWLDLDVSPGVTARDLILSKLITIDQVADESWTATVLAGDPNA